MKKIIQQANHEKLIISQFIHFLEKYSNQK